MIYDDDPYTETPKWWIPYNFIASSEINDSRYKRTHADGWLSDINTIIEPSVNRNWTGSDWVMFNKQLTGYYVVNYDTDNWNALTRGLSAGHLHYFDRIQLIENAFELAEKGEIEIDIPLKLLTYIPLAVEMNSFVCCEAFKRLMTIDEKIKFHNNYHKFQV